MTGFSATEIRYFRFSTGGIEAIPVDGSFADVGPSVSGDRIAFMRSVPDESSRQQYFGIGPAGGCDRPHARPTGVTYPIDDQGNSNPEFKFSFKADTSGYAYNLSTSRLPIGMYVMKVAVGPPGVLLDVPFALQ